MFTPSEFGEEKSLIF